MNGARIAALAGAYSLAMIVGALGFQYIGGIPPCEMCHWQRWPLDAAIIIGLGGATLYALRVIDGKIVTIAAWLALLLIVASGAIGADQALVEWKLIPGPASCTGDLFLLKGNLNLNEPVVRCDVAAWRLFGISLAGYNALFSFGAAVLGALVLAGRLPFPELLGKHENRTA